MQLRGVNINCELTREAQFYSQLHGDTPAGTVEPGLPFRKTWPDETDEVNLMKEKMHRRPNDQLITMHSTNYFGIPYSYYVQGLEPKYITLGMAKKKKYRQGCVWLSLRGNKAEGPEFRPDIWVRLYLNVGFHPDLNSP